MVSRLAVGSLALVALANCAVDVGQGVPWRSPVISTNWANASDYARVGVALRKRVGTASVGSPPEIGTLAYYCECEILDVFSDRGMLVKLLDRRIAKIGAVSRALFELNYLWLDRNQKERRIDYYLFYDPGPGSGPNVWQVWSRWRGVGHLRLVRWAAGSR